MYLTMKRLVLTAVKYFCITLIWVMSATILFGVICRFIILEPLIWAEELSLTCIVWLTFVGSCLAYELNSHVVVDLLVSHLPAPGKRLHSVVVSLITAGLSAVLTVAGYTMIVKTWNSITPGLNISVAVQYAPAFIGGLLMFWLACEKTAYSLVSLAKGRDIIQPRAVQPPGDVEIIPEP